MYNGNTNIIYLYIGRSRAALRCPGDGAERRGRVPSGPYIHTHVHMSVYIYIHIISIVVIISSIIICISISLSLYIYIYTYIYKYIYIYTHVYTWCVYVYIYIYTYAVLSGIHLSSATCLTHVLFKSGQERNTLT